MFFPISTDAPLYHRPIGTLLLIAANAAAFWVTEAGDQTSGWVLRFGDGLHPVEWVTSAFFHFGWLHLVGNMIFLWAFGLVVEGKLGTLRFLALYLALCLLDGAITQLLMLGHAGPARGAGGASGVIFALMAIALVWAPENCFEVLTVYFLPIGLGAFRSSTFEARISMFSLFYLAMNLLFAGLQGFSMSSQLLHLIGAAIGAPLGIVLLKRGWVDCEGWDLFSVLRGDHRRSTLPHPAPPPEADESPETTTTRLSELVQRGRFVEAWHRFQNSRWRAHTLPLDREQMMSWIDGLVSAREWRPAATLLEAYIPHDSTPRARLVLAGIQTQHLHQPRKALRTLASLEGTTLSAEQSDLCTKIRRLCERQLAEGVIELSD